MRAFRLGGRRAPIPATGDLVAHWERLPDVTARPRAEAARKAVDPVAVARTWGRLPELSVAVALGLVAVAIGNRLAREDASSATAVFWLGLVTMIAPVAVRLAFIRVSRAEAIGLLGLLGTGLYLTKVTNSPDALTGFDELIHYRTASDILATGHLYTENPVLPVSPLFPGLEIVTSALSTTTGLGLVTSGLILIGVARLLLVVSLFLLLHELGRSVRLAATGTLLYMGTSTFFSFDAQYAYESLALGLGVFLLYLAARLTRTRRAQPAPRALAAVAAAVAAALAFTHHLTAYATGGMLLLWAVVHLVSRRRLPRDRSPLLFAALLGLVAVAWSVAVATDVFSYFGGPISEAVDGLRGLLEDGGGRRPFESASGARANPVEQLIGFGGTLVTVLALPFGIAAFRRRAPRRALALVLLLLAALYPCSLALRLVGGGAWETSNRASSFLFLGVAFVVSLAVWHWPPPSFVPRVPRARATIAAALTVLVPVSGILLGSSSIDRLPRPYAVASDSLAIDPHGIEAARWAKRQLGPGKRVAADRVNTALMNAYGGQHVITSLGDGVTLSPLFLAPAVGAYEREIVHDGEIGYLVVDRRLEGKTTPPDGSFYESWERTLFPEAYTRTKGLDASRLRKWDRVDRVSRVFDDGSIVVYDVRAVRDAP